MSVIGHIDHGAEGSDEHASNNIARLPLNLLLLVISYLDNVGDLARACRTCRILHYICLPTLYVNVSLHSYDHIRYAEYEDRPEGSGGASPFFMGLNALVTRDVAQYVKRLSIWGEWKEYDLEDCARVGRISDGSMMLNILIRAVIDRTRLLNTFVWKLSTKMLQTVWLGLVQCPTLTSLTVQFPAVRLPRPTMLVPPIASLKYLHITNIDPLCYPDNISLLLLGSKQLEVLKLHWNPRMREAREPSVSLHSYFGRLVSARYKMRLRHVSFQNLYANNDSYSENILHEVIDPETVESFTMISSFGGADDSADMAFNDNSWKGLVKKPNTPSLRKLRGDKVSRMHCEMLTQFRTLERYYLISGRSLTDPPFSDSNSTGQRNGVTESRGDSGDTRSAEDWNSPPKAKSCYPCGCADSAGPFTPPAEVTAVSRLRDIYLENITRNHGHQLRHLLLMPQWRLSSEDLARLVRSCPSLEQLGLGLEMANFPTLRLMIPFLPKLFALRILDNIDESRLTEQGTVVGDAWQEDMLGDEMIRMECHSLRYLGLGDRVFEIRNPELSVTVSGDRGKKVKRVPLERVQNIEIWSMDRLEI